MPPKLAQNWFGERERVTATAIGALFNQLGIAIGFLLAPPIIQNNAQNIPLLLAIDAALALGSGLLVLVFFRSDPPTPPSASQGFAKHDYPFSVVLKTVFRQPAFIVLLLSFGIGIGAFYAISTLMDYLVIALQYPSTDSSLFGMLVVLVGIAGAIIMGVLGDRTRRYKLLLCIALFGSAGCMVWFTLASVPDNRVMVAICCSILGLFMTAVLPVGMDLSVEITYPMPEAITTSLLMMSAQIFGILFIFVMTALQEVSMSGSSWFLTAWTCVSALLMLLFKPEYKRVNAETVVHGTVNTLPVTGS